MKSLFRFLIFVCVSKLLNVYENEIKTKIIFENLVFFFLLENSIAIMTHIEIGNQLASVSNNSDIRGSS